MTDLMEARKKIDTIDEKLLHLLEERMNVSDEVAEYKRSTGKAVYDKKREEEKLDALEQLATTEFNGRAAREILRQLMAISRKYQYQKLEAEVPEISFSSIKELPVSEETKIAYFGVPGTNTQQAMENFFGADLLLTEHEISCSTFEKVMQLVADGQAEYGVLPIENSSTGGIHDNFDLLVEYNNVIVGEYVLPIRQCLMALPGAEISKLQHVYSHPQGILQCKTFFETYTECEPVEYASTAECAKKVAEEGDITQAAIASERAAREYGLKILLPDIQTQNTNQTRFLIIAKKHMAVRDSNRISLCLELPHEEGALYQILSHFMFHNLNMTHIESRPIPERPFEYRFFIDFEGEMASEEVQHALYGLQAESVNFRLLGCYRGAEIKN